MRSGRRISAATLLLVASGAVLDFAAAQAAANLADKVFFDGFELNYVFVTSTTHAPSTLGGLAGADTICQQRANAAGLPGTYRAWLSTLAVNAQSRLSGSRGWIRTDGKPVADQVSDLTSGHLFYPISFDQNGVFVGDATVSTATSANGNLSSAATCGDWTSTAGTTTVAGIAANDTGTFTQALNVSCSQPNRLYCFGVNAAQVVAPPVVSARRAFASSAWTPGGGLASADAKCAEDAAAGGLAGTYKALLATSTASAISRFNTAAGTAPWARPDNTLLAPTAAGLNSALTYLDATPNSNAAGTAWFSGALWSGADTLIGVGSAAQTCLDWTSGGAASTGLAGVSGYTKVSNWRGGGTFSCNQTFLALACLQE